MIIHSNEGEIARVEELPGPRFRVTLLKPGRSSSLRRGDYSEGDGLQVRLGHPLVFTGRLEGKLRGKRLAPTTEPSRGSSRVTRIEPLVAEGDRHD